MRTTHALKRWKSILGMKPASDELVKEQVWLLANQLPLCYSVIIVNSCVLAILVSGKVNLVLSFFFPAIAIPTMIFRIITWTRSSKKAVRRNDVPAMRRILRGTIIGANVMAIILAAWAVSIMRALTETDIAIVPLFTILSLITCAYCLSSYPIAAYSVIGTGTLYIAIAMVSTGVPMLIAMAANIVLVSGMVVYIVGHQHRQLRRVVGSRKSLDEQRQLAHDLAHSDPLTGLPNRRALLRAVDAGRTTSPNMPVALIMLDLNGFKPVNDTYGHSAGDHLLKEVAARLLGAVDKDDLVARLGGDEFCVLLRDRSERAQQVVKRIRQEIKRPVTIADHQIRLGAAIGLVVREQMPAEPSDLLRMADIALYDSKMKGGVSNSTFEPEMEARVMRRTLIEQALANDEQLARITLHFQPIFEMRTGRHAGYEALARWEHEALGRISPAEFIECAERNGMVKRLTLHLFRRALSVARHWDEHLKLSFNLSGSGLSTAGFEKDFPAMMKEVAFSPRRLKLEVTETALMNDTAASWKVLEHFQSLGAEIVLDDFGAGHASIGYLKDLEIDGIKLDGSLIENIVHDARSRRLLAGILQLCRSIGVNVTAEMVETQEQFIALQAFPVDYLQGYLLGKPLSGDEIKYDIQDVPEACNWPISATSGNW